MELRTGINRKFESAPRVTDRSVPMEQALLRCELDEVLCEYRQRQDRTLREASSGARVSLRHPSEVERGQKKASSELFLPICKALNVPLSYALRLVANRVDSTEDRVPLRMCVPDSVPELLVRSELGST